MLLTQTIFIDCKAFHNQNQNAKRRGIFQCSAVDTVRSSNGERTTCDVIGLIQGFLTSIQRELFPRGDSLRLVSFVANGIKLTLIVLASYGTRNMHCIKLAGKQLHHQIKTIWQFTEQIKRISLEKVS